MLENTFPNQSATRMIALSAAALGVLGLSTLVYSKIQSDNHQRLERELLKAKQNRKSRTDEDVSEFLVKNSHKTTLYFNRNDELVDERTALKNPSRYHKVTLALGCKNVGEGSQQLTKSSFWGDKKEENA